MTVLVDSAVWPWRGRRWAHLVSDESYEELHAFARRLGLDRRAFQGDHYDIPSDYREKAVELGAEPVDARDLVRRLRSAGLRRRSVASPAMANEDPIDVVQRFCAAWAEGDRDALMAFFRDDAVYHNIPVEPVKGRDNIRATIDGFTAGVESIEFKVLNIAAAGNVVLTERIDVFVLGDRRIELPVSGTFEVDADGAITAWRDYFDLNQFMSQLG